jgi:hypothetical protein
MQIEKDDKLIANPADAGLPTVPTNDSGVKFDTLPPNTVIFSYGQTEGEAGMMLTIDQNMPKQLKFDATMHVLGKDDYDAHPTSTCPIVSFGTIYESWPYPIGPMILKSPRLLPGKDISVCE